MSFHNRLLLNRAALAGLRRVEVMVLASAGRFTQAAAAVEGADGRIGYREEKVGYLRVDVPIDRVTALGNDPDVDAYQLSTLSRAAWYRDTPPRINADMFREYEMAPPGGTGAAAPLLALPALPAARAIDEGFTGDEDTGLKEWSAQHPAADGRGVTIALLETAQPELSHPTLGDATALDGRRVAKLAGILNTIDPGDPDDTRVVLHERLSTKTTWSVVGDRTYILPHAGEFAFGIFSLPAGGNLVHQFGVLRDLATGALRVDANGNADFTDEAPVADVNDRFDVRALSLTHPRRMNLAFVAGRGRTPDVAHIYVSRSDHQSMTLSVAAGSRTTGSLAYGVAPGARILLVRNNTAAYRLRDIVEGYIEAARVPDVDLIASATGFELVPDTGGDFAGLLMSRIIAAYGKPIFQSAGNRHLWMNSAVALGDVFSIGGSMGPKTFDAFYGGGTLHEIIVHPSSAAGPAVDGAMKPDFLAPMHRIAAGLWGRAGVAIPKNAPTYQLPPGYQISCCTSASAPYAAGLAARLLSAMKQDGIPYTFPAFSRALRAGSRFITGWPVHQQGNGVLDANGAWRELSSRVDPPRIRSTAPIVHPLAAYAAQGDRGVGLFESEGWRAGMRGRREITLRRESGTDSPVTYRVSLIGNDGTFTAPPAVTLPLNSQASVRIDIDVHHPGVHDAIVALHDPSTNASVFRTAVTIVAAEPFERESHVLQWRGSVPLLRKKAHYVQMPAGVSAMSVELEVLRGAAGVNIIPSHSLFLAYQGQIGPQNGRTFPKGRYRIVIPQPAAGTWTIDVNNTSTRRERDQALVSDDEVEYVITLRLQDVRIVPGARGHGVVTLDLANARAALDEPLVQLATAAMASHEGTLAANGLPSFVEVNVPSGASTLLLNARGLDRDASTLEIHLYDCTSGECFSHNYTIPAARSQQLLVRRPTAGRWVAAINAAPFPSSGGRFVLEEIVAGPVQRQAGNAGSRPTGARWRETIDVSALAADRTDTRRVVLFEAIDAAAERDELLHRWEIRDIFPALPNAPVAAGIAIWDPGMPPPSAAHTEGEGPRALVVQTQHEPHWRVLEVRPVVLFSRRRALHEHGRRAEHYELRR